MRLAHEVDALRTAHPKAFWTVVVTSMFIGMVIGGLLGAF